MEVSHGSTTKIPNGNDNSYSTDSVRNSTNVKSKSSSNACKSKSRGCGSCSFCVQKKRTMELNNVEFIPSINRETELREVKVESPISPTNTGNNYNGFPPDVLPVTSSVTKSLVIDVENGTSTAIKKGERKWRYFPGKNRFFCNGWLISAPNISFSVCCFLLIVITFSLFIIFDGPYLATKWSIAIPILGVLMFLIVIISMLKTTFSDPGIIPRASQQEAEYMERLYSTNNVGRPPPRTKDVVVNGQILKVKYCFTCKMFRPPRASHCGVCDNCVDRFDHHCPFLGNCIGKRNYRHFYSFVLSLSFLCVFVLSCATAHLVLISKDKGNFLEALKDSPTSAIVVIISFFGMWTVLGLAGFHSYLISVEQTTNEDIKGLFGRSAIKNPFSRGNIFRNCSFILCGPIQPSLIGARDLVTEEFLTSLPRKNDANGIPTSSYCNRSSLTVQTSLKTGPQCVEGANRAGIAKVQNQQIMTTEPQTHVALNQPSTQNLTAGQPLPVKVVSEGITLTCHSPDSGSGLMYTSASSNRSLSNMNSGSMRNLYNSIEEDPASADSGSESNLSHDQCSSNKAEVPVQYLVRSTRSSHQPSIKDDFDDPTMLHMHPHSTNQLRHGYSYNNTDTELDMDDPVSEQGLRRIQLNNTSHSKRSRASSGIDGSAISLPSTSGSSNGRKKFSSVQSLKSQEDSGRNRNGSIGANNIPTTKNPKRGQQSINNNNGILQSSMGSSSSALKNQNGPSSNHSRISNRKLSKSTMIDSPLHLDAIT